MPGQKERIRDQKGYIIFSDETVCFKKENNFGPSELNLGNRKPEAGKLS